jgi:hypothetical protein
VRKLVCNFEAPDDDVYTLYDNWEKSVARFPHVSSSRRRHHGRKGLLPHLLQQQQPGYSCLMLLVVNILSHQP